MDLFRFINSKDIREYLRQIDYSFPAPEAALSTAFSYISTKKFFPCTGGGFSRMAVPQR